MPKKQNLKKMQTNSNYKYAIIVEDVNAKAKKPVELILKPDNRFCM